MKNPSCDWWDLRFSSPQVFLSLVLQGSSEIWLVLGIFPGRFYLALITLQTSNLPMFSIRLHRNNSDILGLWCFLFKKNLEGPFYPSAAAVSMVKECYVEILIQGEFLQHPGERLVVQWLQGRNSHLHLCSAAWYTCSFPQPCLSVSPSRFGFSVSVSPVYLLFAMVCSSTHPSSSPSVVFDTLPIAALGVR